MPDDTEPSYDDYYPPTATPPINPAAPTKQEDPTTADAEYQAFFPTRH